MMFSGPSETQASEEGEEVGGLKSQCFPYVINLVNNMAGLTGPSRKFPS